MTKQEKLQPEAFYRTLLESTGDSVWVVDREGRYLFVNDSMAKKLGLSREEILGKTYRNLHPADDARDFLRRAEKAFRGEVVRYEYLNPENRRWSLRTMSPVVDESEKIVAVSILSKDITERKQMEEALRSPETRSQNIIAASPDAIIVCDLNGNIIECNQATLDNSGYSSKEEIIGKNSLEFISGKDRERAMENLRKTLEQGSVKNLEYTLLTKDGREYHAELSASVMLDSHGNPTGFVGVIRDITERKMSEERYSDLAESITDTFFAMDRNLRYTYWNKASENLTGIKAEDAIGKSIFEIFPDREDTRKAAAVYQRVLQTRQRETFVNEFQLKGKDFFFEISVYPTREGISVFVKDITERKRVEGKLREYAEELKRLVDERTRDIRFLSNIAASISQAVMAQDNDRKIIYVNKAFEDMYGYRKEEVVGKPTSRLAADGTADETHHEITEGLESREYWSGEILRKRKNGEIFPIWTTMSYLRDETGEIVGRFGVSTDITDRKKLERRFQHSEERLRRILENAPIGILVTDATGNYVEVNAELCRIAQASKEELLKLNYIQHRERRVLPFYEKALHGEVCEYAGPYHTTMRELDTWRRIVFAPLLDAQGKITGVVGLVEDITEKKELENRLQRSEERLRRIFDNTPMGIILTDEKGNYVEVNNFQCKSFSKAPREELLRQNFFDQKDRTLQPFFKKAIQGELAEYEGWYITTARGITYWVRTIFTPIFDLDGKVGGVIMIVEDRTVRKRLEEQLLNQTRLATIGATAASVGHDLRNPLQVIVNTLFLVKKKFEGMPTPLRELAEEQGLVEQCGTIEKQVEYMNKIVSDLQDYARPVKPELMETDIHKLINDTLSTITVPENIKVTTVIEEDFPKLMIDSAMIKRVLTNLATNAVQAMPDGGRLTVKASKEGETASISVEDTGVGIPAKNIEKLFQPLFTTKAKGVGLGLAVCRRMVEAHGGKIVVESKVGKGSTFIVKIPLRREVT